MMHVQKILAAKRLSIPESLAKKYGLTEGTFVILKDDGRGILIVPAEIKERTK